MRQESADCSNKLCLLQVVIQHNNSKPKASSCCCHVLLLLIADHERADCSSAVCLRQAVKQDDNIYKPQASSCVLLPCATALLSSPWCSRMMPLLRSCTRCTHPVHHSLPGPSFPRRGLWGWLLQALRAAAPSGLHPSHACCLHTGRRLQGGQPRAAA